MTSPDESPQPYRPRYVDSCGRALVSDFAPIVRIPPKSDNPSGAQGSLPNGQQFLRFPLPYPLFDVASLLVTLDGPGGTGKSTVSRAVASRTGLPHLDTGAFYRAATLAVLDAGVDPADEDGVASVVASLVLDQKDGRMLLNGRDISTEIRSDAVTSAVSAVSAHPKVRALLVDMQRAWVESHGGGGVVEGRDIGSVVFPDADLKVFLDASPRVRAKRRAQETGEDVAEVLSELNRRDHVDSTRSASPLTVPDGAIVVDTTELTFDQVVTKLVNLIRSRS